MAKNQWIDQNENVIVSRANPNDGLEFEMYAPLINERRVRKTQATYRPYAGNSAWVKAANRRLADAAHRAFERRWQKS